MINNRLRVGAASLLSLVLAVPSCDKIDFSRYREETPSTQPVQPASAKETKESWFNSGNGRYNIPLSISPVVGNIDGARMDSMLQHSQSMPGEEGVWFFGSQINEFGEGTDFYRQVNSRGTENKIDIEFKTGPDLSLTAHLEKVKQKFENEGYSFCDVVETEIDGNVALMTKFSKSNRGINRGIDKEVSLIINEDVYVRVVKCGRMYTIKSMGSCEDKVKGMKF